VIIKTIVLFRKRKIIVIRVIELIYIETGNVKNAVQLYNYNLTVSWIVLTFKTSLDNWQMRYVRCN